MSTNNAPLNTDALKWRLAETIVWCTRHGPIPDTATAATALRTPQLCPSGFTYSKDEHGSADMEPLLVSQANEALIVDVVEEVARLRVAQLKLNNNYPLSSAQHLAGGRLLCYAPYENLREGVEQLETQGYFDASAVPPWDTWLWSAVQPTRHKYEKHHYEQSFWYGPYLI